MAEKQPSLTLRNFDPTLWRQLKVAAAERGFTLTKFVQESLRSVLRRTAREKGIR